MSFKLRLLLATGAVMLVAFLLMTAASIVSFKEVYMATLSEQGATLTKLIRGQALQQLQLTDGDVDSLSRFSLHLAEVSRGLSTILEAAIVDPEGRVVAHPDPEQIGGELEPAPVAVPTGELAEWQERLVQFLPLEYDGQPIAYLRVDFDRGTVAATIRELTARSLLSALVGLIVVFLFSIYLYNRGIERPLVALRETLLEVGGGNLLVTMPEFRDREFDAAARAVQRMTESLREIVNKVLHLAQGLTETSTVLERDFAILDQEAGRVHRNLDEAARILLQLVDKLRTSQQRLEAAILQVHETSTGALEISSSIEEVDETTSRLHETLERTLERLGRITEEIQAAAQRNQETEVHADNLASGVAELVTSIGEVTASTSHNLAIARNVRSHAEEGRAAMEAAVNEMDTIRATVGQLDSRAKTLRERSEAIEGILRVIHQVAEKTNLLALNASIIAAQSGEHGRSFAVVAEEIRSLAHRVQNSTNEIEALVAGVQEETAAVTEQIRTAIEKVGHGEEQLGRTREKLGRILEASLESDRMSQAIAKAMDEQATVVANLSETASKIQSLIHEVTKLSIAQAEQARSLAGESQNVTELAMSVKRAIRSQTDGVRSVSEHVQRIMNALEEVNASASEQTENSRRVSDTTAENLAALNQAIEMIRSFRGRLVKLQQEAHNLDEVLGRFRV